MKRKKLTLSDVMINIVLVLGGIVIFYPFYNSVLVSFMTEKEMMTNTFALYVKDFTLAAYKQIFSDGIIFTGYKNSIVLLLIGVPLSMLVSSALAYSLSRNKFLFSKTINNMIIFTMYFGGGIVPVFLLIRNLGLMNSMWAIILPHAVTTYNVILIKNYFYTIPDSLAESAKIDGANDLIIFGRIFLPLAKPILATVGLFYTVAKWNEWYYPMLFLKNMEKWPVQLVLREIIMNTTEEIEESGAVGEIFSKNIKMATIVVTMAPIMVVYPFLQKYFMKGIMVGAVKG
ncbi:MAG: carbohydrate ABC transporter permease [Clostridia bacterium]|nr:carbohydrate ABC transporter permease [Clostridia bacterium]